MSEFRAMCCGECGISFHVPETFISERQQKGGSWYCPNGHSRIFRETDVQKLEREKVRLAQRIAQKDDEIQEAWDAANQHRRIAAAHKGQVTKLKNRAAAGVCPCCNRSFQNLKRHMDGQHPDYAEKPALKVLEGGKSA